MENSDNTAEALAEIRRLEQLIQNCRHGGPAHTDHQETPWKVRVSIVLSCACSCSV